MELFIFLLFVYLFFLFIKNVSPKNEIQIVQDRTVKHGHRCYTEGLNNSEREVVNVLANSLSPKEYFIFNNLIIPSINSKSTQIDHIIVSRYGVFVLETKEYNGWIFSHKNREKWAITYQNGEKHDLPNPIRQNYGHVQALRKALPFINDFFDFVVFVGEYEFKTPRIENVLRLQELSEMILYHNKPVISDQRLFMAIGRLSYMCQAIDITPGEHKENIQRMLEGKRSFKKELL